MSVRLRLTLYWASIVSLLLLGAGLAVFLLFQRLQWGRLDGALMEEADTAAQTIAHGADAAQIVARLSEERDLGPGRRVWVGAGKASVASGGDSDPDLPVLRDADVTRGIVNGRHGAFRYAVIPFLLNGAQAYLADGVDARTARESVSRLRATLLLVMPVLLAVSISVGYWLAGWALAPLVTVADALSEIKPRDLSCRLAPGPVEDELGRLIRAINGLLERIERASLAERRFAADAAHELRTPLTVLHTGIEVALRRERTAAEYELALNSALRDTAAVCSMADDLLALTRLDHELSAGRILVDLRAVAEEVLDVVEPLTAAKHLRVETNLATDAKVQGNREHLRRLLINLLDNALKFTPDKGWIAVSLESQSDIITLRIADSGPGIQDTDLPFIFERFFRGHNGHGEPGKGLGLSLCREIVELHDGEMIATNRAGGGAEFVVKLRAWLPSDSAAAST
jgi:two-component system, OmpR family, sensor kinase